MEHDRSDKRLQGQHGVHLPQSPGPHVLHHVNGEGTDNGAERILGRFDRIGRKRADLKEDRTQDAHPALAVAVEGAVDSPRNLRHQNVGRPLAPCRSPRRVSSRWLTGSSGEYSWTRLLNKAGLPGKRRYSVAREMSACVARSAIERGLRPCAPRWVG